MRQRLLALLLLAAFPLLAAEQKLGYIYSDQVIKEYQGMSEANAALNKAKTAFRQEADSIYQLLGKAKSDFDAQKLILSEEGKAAKNAEVDDLQRRYDNTVREIYGPNGKLEQKTQEVMAPVLQKIKDAVEKLATSEGYTIVFDASESKLAILYSSTAANLTRSVLDELNREFKPVASTEVGEKRYAVCPIYEANDEAQAGSLGEQTRSFIFEAIRSQPQTQMVSSADMNSALLNRGVAGKTNVTQELAFSVGNDLQADYVFFGSVSKSGKKITVTLNIGEPRMNNAYPPESNTANRIEDLRQVVSNLIPKLIQKLPKQ